MNLITKAILASAAAVLLASCGNSGGGTDAAAAAPQGGFQQRSGNLFDDDSQKLLGRYAAVNPKYANKNGGAARLDAPAENKMFEGEFAKRDFKAKDYNKKSFWGSKDYTKKVYSGDTDGSRFRQNAHLSNNSAREGSQSSRYNGNNYQTGNVNTGAAREANQRGVPTGSDAETDIRRKVFKQPEVRDYNQQRALTVDDTKDMLGR